MDRCERQIRLDDDQYLPKRRIPGDIMFHRKGSVPCPRLQMFLIESVVPVAAKTLCHTMIKCNHPLLPVVLFP